MGCAAARSLLPPAISYALCVPRTAIRYASHCGLAAMESVAGDIHRQGSAEWEAGEAEDDRVADQAPILRVRLAVEPSPPASSATNAFGRSRGASPPPVRSSAVAVLPVTSFGSVPHSDFPEPEPQTSHCQSEPDALPSSSVLNWTHTSSSPTTLVADSQGSSTDGR
jgi:hypothetical protein